ncbi:hypothetical protein EJB05_09220, partial [Eragrostis curvula]
MLLVGQQLFWADAGSARDQIFISPKRTPAARSSLFFFLQFSAPLLSLVAATTRRAAAPIPTPSPAPSPATSTHQLFFSYFKELVGKQVTVELKNDLAISGTLHSVDQYLNIKLENTRVVNEDKYPHMLSVRNCFIRGSVVRYVLLPPDGVDIDILHDATRREARGG